MTPVGGTPGSARASSSTFQLLDSSPGRPADPGPRPRDPRGAGLVSAEYLVCPRHRHLSPQQPRALVLWALAPFADETTKAHNSWVMCPRPHPK